MEVIFFLDMQPGQTLRIYQTSNTFRPRHQLAYGEPCPGKTIIDCSDSDYQIMSWKNEFDNVQRVYYMIDDQDETYDSTSNGAFFTMEWSYTDPSTID